MINSLEAGRVKAALMIYALPGSQENEAAAIGFAGCESYRWMRSPATAFLSQQASEWSRGIVQGIAEAHPEFTDYVRQTNLTKWGLTGVVLGSTVSNGNESCETLIFQGRIRDEFKLDDSNLFATTIPIGPGGGGFDMTRIRR